MEIQQNDDMQPPDTGQEVEQSIPAANFRNPRRCSPEDSVSLRPSLKKEHRSDVQSNKAVADPQESPLMGGRKRSSSQSSASQWFKRKNERVEGENDGLMQESPFFLDSHPTDSHSEPEEAKPPASAWASGRFASHDSENSDLRDVIDDLTVENKQLRQRLKRYEKSNVPDMNRDKMFELRVHGLSSSRKRDLEQLLADFVTKINMKERRNPHAASSENNSSNIISSASNTRSKGSKTGQSAPADSGYASMSASAAQTSANSRLMPPSGPSSNTASSQDLAQGKSTKSRNSNIRSYLHNIPESLLPKVSPLMSERAKKMLVVQRLEYLFTGTSAAPGPHSQPLQQQEVSNSAAREDPFKFEGAREAPILSAHSKLALERSPNHRQDSNSDESENSPEITHVAPGHKSPDQRPTRPLDLDIHRAQVPEDNMQYIRHLGLGSPTRHNDESDGWVYLNLLMNMAQLHTLNVTPEFIKRAVSEMSERFELSSDGRKIRWKGGDEGTKFSTYSGSRSETTSENSPHGSNASQNQGGGTGLDRNQTSLSSDALSSRPLPSRSVSGKLRQSHSMEASTSSLPLKSSRDSRFDYKPVVFKQQRSTEPSEDYMYPEYESQSGIVDDTTGLSSSNRMSHSREGASSQRTSNAPIIFYKNAFFCTDLAGDLKAIHKAKQPVDGDHLRVLGISDCNHIEHDSDRHQALPKDKVRPLSKEEIERAKISSFHLVPLSDAPEIHDHFQELPVCGLGGVTPQDNFLVDVRTKHPTKLVPREKQADGKSQKMYSVVSAKTTNLPPSRLPPPSYVFLTSSSSSDLADDIDSEDERTDSSLDEDMPVPAEMLTQMSSYEEDESEMDVDDDNSIDMLHTARQADPNAVAEQLDEEDIIDGILPDELPAGSSAATAGGGSDCASGGESPMSTAMGPPSLKRGRSHVDSSMSTMSRWQKTPRLE